MEKWKKKKEKKSVKKRYFRSKRRVDLNIRRSKLLHKTDPLAAKDV